MEAKTEPNRLSGPQPSRARLASAAPQSLGGRGEARSLAIRKQGRGEHMRVVVSHVVAVGTVPHVLWRCVAETLLDATLAVFDRSGHQPFLEQPEEFAATVADWMPEWEY